MSLLPRISSIRLPNRRRHPCRVPPVLMAVVVLALGVTSALIPGVGSAARSPGCTVQVTAGQSIQAAIDGASTGATVCVGPGTYAENLLIAKDGITLQGAGAGKTVLTLPAQPAPVCLNLFFPPVDLEQNGINGICVANVNPGGNRVATVSDVRVTGFTVEGFPGAGIVFAYANRPRADHNVAKNNGYYGVTAFASTNGLFEENQSHGSGDAGIYLGNSPNAGFTITNNIVTGALWGVLVRDSSVGTVTNNDLHDNCAGLVFLNTGALEGTVGIGVSDWVATGNTAARNEKQYDQCTAQATGLPFTLTGVGILILGGDHIALVDNAVRNNRPAGAPTSVNGVALAGGIVVVSGAKISIFGPPYYGTDATHNTILDNQVLNNQPDDLAYDGLGVGNLFVGNQCATSSPAGLCH